MRCTLVPTQRESGPHLLGGLPQSYPSGLTTGHASRGICKCALTSGRLGGWLQRILRYRAPFWLSSPTGLSHICGAAFDAHSSTGWAGSSRNLLEVPSEREVVIGTTAAPAVARRPISPLPRTDVTDRPPWRRAGAGETHWALSARPTRHFPPLGG